MAALAQQLPLAALPAAPQRPSLDSSGQQACPPPPPPPWATGRDPSPPEPTLALTCTTTPPLPQPQLQLQLQLLLLLPLPLQPPSPLTPPLPLPPLPLPLPAVSPSPSQPCAALRTAGACCWRGASHPASLPRTARAWQLRWRRPGCARCLRRGCWGQQGRWGRGVQRARALLLLPWLPPPAPTPTLPPCCACRRTWGCWTRTPGMRGGRGRATG